ncbi:MAG: DUF58 domain-containing protein [bacterium]
MRSSLQQDALHTATATHAEGESLAQALPPLLVEASRLSHSLSAGIHGRRRAGTGETFWQYRHYLPGDASSLIDWRQSARSDGALFVRQQEWESATTIWLWPDPKATMAYRSRPDLPSKQHRAQVLCIALSSLLARAGERTGLAGAALAPFMGRTTPTRLAEALLTQPLPPQLPDIQGTGLKRAIFFSDFFQDTEQLTKTISSLNSNGVEGILLQINDPSELEFPFTGRTEFHDISEQEHPVLFGDAHAIAADYRRKVQAHRECLRDSCAHIGWSFLHHNTYEPALTCLTSLYSLLQRER